MIQKQARVLIVEDDEDDFIIASDCLDDLADYAFSIDWVSTPDEALALLKENRHDICLLDYQLGALTGLTVLEKATNIQCRIPIIMLTGQSDDLLDKAALDAGAVDFVVKTEFDSPRFARSIRYALSRQEIEKERLERINLETKSRSKDRFLAHLSHELRTPLTSILGYTELLLESNKAKAANPELNIILNNGKHLLSLLNDVLDLSKIAAKKLELNPIAIKFEDFLIDIHTLLKVAAADKGITLELTCSSPVPQEVYQDPTRLRQVLINLVHNAIKFTSEGFVRLNVAAKIEYNQCQLMFEVVDTGTGIPAQKLQNIFQPFEQVEDMVSRKETGAGLGLAISSELAKAMGGGISVTSEPGKGSCFTLQIAENNANSEHYSMLTFTASALAKSGEALPSLAGKILVVDDIADIRELIGHIVSSFGLSVVYAENGLQAIDAIAAENNNSQPFAAVLIDIHMPLMDGREAVVNMRKRGFLMPIIALTAATMKGEKEKLQSLGFNAVVPKPVNKALLHRELSKLLAKADPEKSLLSPPSQTSGPGSVRRVLLVEDDIDAAELTKLLLESLGCEVEVAHSGQACGQVIALNSAWDIALLDQNLPDTSGLKLATLIHKTATVGEIILVSGESIEQSTLDANGISRSLLKPINKHMLASII
ncbi:response regulator [Paraglaciecola aquimarina]|uniref:histidine kinase n=1 Tax=Paraglaciecola aquimarina TaxID=1235557 RepID=A0ABU3SSK4_9ALTE|nr:response regulator [Paraglaciecola aquimarina]MDU0352997.1 response regulator [Paraglaciecola aquimarina]